MRTRTICMLMFLLPVTVAADNGEGKEPTGVMKVLNWVKTLIDSSAVATVDRRYIEQPKKPWAVELRSTASQATLKMDADWPIQGQRMDFSASTTNGFSTSLGAWIGYRGYGLGLSKELTHGNGSTFSLGAMGGSFGINLRISSYRSQQPEFQLDFEDAEDKVAIRDKVDLDDPIRVRSLFLDAYYMFNGKHFSYAAAYDQSLIQRRSAGSFLAGLMYYHTKVAYDQEQNWQLVLLMREVGKLKLTQADVGAGYAYNWVPAKGLLVSAMLMPMVTFYNKMEIYKYMMFRKSDNMWIYMLDNDEVDELDENSVRLVELDAEKTSNRIGWNIDARLSVSYNWSRYYLRMYGHYNRFRYSNDDGSGRLTDWTAYAAFGFRF